MTAISALGINLCKNWLGCALLAIHLFVLSRITGQPLMAAPARSWWYLGLSGVVGIVIGDTFSRANFEGPGGERIRKGEAIQIHGLFVAYMRRMGWMLRQEIVSTPGAEFD